MTTLAHVAPVVTINEAPLADPWLAQLVGMRLERAIGLVGRGTLRFSDPGYAISAGGPFKIGAPVRIGLRGGGLLMNATVTGVSLEQSISDHPELVIVIDDAAQKLASGTHTEAYVQSRWSDIISAIAARNGLSARVSATASVEKYTLQAGTDLAFLDGIVQRAGMMWWLDGPGADVLRVEKAGTSSGSVTLRLAEDLQAFSVQASAVDPAGGNGSGAGPLGVLATSGGAVVASGTCAVNDAIKPAVTLTIDEAGPASGSYQVRQVEHLYAQGEFHTRFVAGDPLSGTVVEPTGLPRPEPGLLVSGLLIGAVTNIDDPESLGRVRLHYPGVSNTLDTPWARVAVPTGSAPLRPAVNDEVVVGFEGDDMRRPIVIGVLSTQAGPAAANDAIVTPRLTSRGGNTVELVDATAGTVDHISIGLAGGKGSIRLGADSLDIEIPPGKPLRIRAGKARFEIAADGSVTIAGRNVSIKAEQAVSIEATAQMTAKSSGTTNVEGTKVHVKGIATTSVEAGAQLALKGGMVAIN